MKQLLNYSFVVFSFFILMNSLSAQKMEEITHREVNIHFADSSIKAYFLLEKEKIRLKPDVYYFWYENNSIKINQGDYKGRLLDGKYEVVNRDGNLITKGQISKGLKINEWKKWNASGHLLAISHWKKGRQTGSFKTYNNGSLIEEGFYLMNHKNGTYKKFENDTLIEKGTFKNGVLQGKVTQYANDTVLGITTYKKGKVIIKKEKEDKPEKIKDSYKQKDNKEKNVKSNEKKNKDKKEKQKDIKPEKGKEKAGKKEKEPKEKVKKEKKERND